MEQVFLCITCGTQYPPGISKPDSCKICSDERQYIPKTGQAWMEKSELKRDFGTRIVPLSKNLYSLKVQPDFALANRALLVVSPEGNILWDCIPLPDENAIRFINELGGLKAIAISHPHYYTAMNDWADIFSCPVYLHAADETWPEHKSAPIHFWRGSELLLWDGVSLIHTGGHFPGSCILHVPALSAEGTVLSGDSLYLSRSKQHLAVMFSYPNQIPLSREEFAAFESRVTGLSFDTLYGAFDNQDLVGNAMTVFQNSMRRYNEIYTR